MEAYAADLNGEQLVRLSVRDVADRDGLAAGDRIRVTFEATGIWASYSMHGQMGTVKRIRVDDSGDYRRVFVLVVLDSGKETVFARDAIEKVTP